MEFLYPQYEGYEKKKYLHEEYWENCEDNEELRKELCVIYYKDHVKAIEKSQRHIKYLEGIIDELGLPKLVFVDLDK